MRLQLRFPQSSDAAAIAAIYAPYCTRHINSFETEPPSVEEMALRIEKTMRQYAWLVLDAGSELAGYAYATRHRDRAAYRWSVDVAVYVDAAHQRAGLGRRLYTALLPLLAAQNYYRAYAGIALPNAASVGLHEALGFRPIGIYRGVGYKLGAWRDTGWWELELQPQRNPPGEPRPLSAFSASELALLLHHR